MGVVSGEEEECKVLFEECEYFLEWPLKSFSFLFC